MKNLLKLFITLQFAICFCSADYMTSTERKVKSVSWMKATAGYSYVVIVAADNSGSNKAFIYRTNNQYCDIDGAKAVMAQALSAKATQDPVYFTSTTDFLANGPTVGLPPSGSATIASWDFYSMQVGSNN